MKKRALLEVALLIGVLPLASTALAAAREYPEPDAGMIAAVDVQTNRFVEGITQGDFETWYPGVYRGFQWAREATEVGSNGLFRLDYAVFDPHYRNGVSPQELSILLYRLPAGSAVRGALHAVATPESRAPRGQRPARRATPSGLAIAVIEDALVTARSFATNAWYYSFFGDSQGLSLVSHLPDPFPGAETFGGTAVRRVSFRLQPRRHRWPELVMEHAPLLVDLRPGQVEPFRATLAEDVSLFHLQYWDPLAADWVEQWTATNPLPQMVQVTLGVGQRRGLDGLPGDLNSRIVALPGTTVAADIQGPGLTNRPPFLPSPDQPPFEVLPPLAAADASTAEANGLLAARGGGNPGLARRHPSKHDSSHDVALEWLGRSGVELARYVLANDRAGSGGQQIDSKLNKWAGGPGDRNGVLARLDLNHYAIGGGSVSVRIEDQESKFNINLVDEVILQQALTVMGVDTAQLPGLVDSILDWRDRDDHPNPDGAESATYLASWPPYFAKNGPLDELSELLLVRGVTPQMYLGLRANGPAPTYAVGLADLFAPLSSGPLNINTASRAVLQIVPGIDENVASAIITARAGPDGVEGTEDDTPFCSPQESARVPGLPPTLLQGIARYFTVRSSIFEAQVVAQIDDEERRFVALLRRNSSFDIQLLNFHWE